MNLFDLLPFQFGRTCSFISQRKFRLLLPPLHLFGRTSFKQLLGDGPELLFGAQSLEGSSGMAEDELGDGFVVVDVPLHQCILHRLQILL